MQTSLSASQVHKTRPTTHSSQARIWLSSEHLRRYVVGGFKFDWQKAMRLCQIPSNGRRFNIARSYETYEMRQTNAESPNSSSKCTHAHLTCERVPHTNTHTHTHTFITTHVTHQHNRRGRSHPQITCRYLSARMYSLEYSLLQHPQQCWPDI